MKEERSRRALVLGGGGSKGAIQVGFLRALDEYGIEVHEVIAASVGAINGAFYAAGVSPRSMAREWAAVRRGDLFGFNWSLLWNPGGARSLYTASRLRRFLADRLPVRRFDELSIPLTIVATDLATGDPYYWEEGDVVEAILASTAVPGLLPPVDGPHGRPLIDGALSDNVPVELALSRGASGVLGILCRTCARCYPTQGGLTGILGQAFGIAVDCRWRADGRRYAARPDVLIIEPELGQEVPSLDFSHGDELCRQGYRISREALSEWLAGRELEPGRLSVPSAGVVDETADTME